MKERVNYEMTEADLKKLIEASKPTPCIMIGSYVSPTPQENANMAWAKLGKKMGFDPMTVQPIPGKSERFFSAVPVEGEEAIKEKDFFFTFGYGQIPGAGYYCKIKAVDISEAIEIMQKRTLKYTFCYDSAEEAGVERFSLKECFWDEAHRGWSDHE